MKILFSFLLLLSSLFAHSQTVSVTKTPKDTTHYYYDTVKTLAWYVTNLNTGEATASYVFKVTKSKLDFVDPPAAELKKDSFTVKKAKVPFAVIYFVPVTVVDSVASKKAHKLVPTVVFSQIPAELILFDINKNFDYLLPKPIKPTGAAPMNAKK